MRSREDFEKDPLIEEAICRGFIEIHGERVTYNINQKKSYNWADPEEWVRAYTLAFLILEKKYLPICIRMEVTVPRRIPEDSADIVVYMTDKCTEPFLVVENKKEGISETEKKQAIEQLFGNSNSLRAPMGLMDYGEGSIFYDVANFPSMERKENVKGDRNSVPEQYGDIPEYTFIAGPGNNDIQPVGAKQLETKVKRAHSIIWAGGKRDPLQAFDEWSKIMLAKVEDERHTPNNQPRKFQVGTKESYVAVASRIHDLFRHACLADPTIFAEGAKITLTDKKIADVVEVLQDICITDTSVDNIGAAFEIFFGSVFRGELGQYFTMRPLARFTVAMLDIQQEQYVIDPTCGSGGFLLEVLLQVWNRLDSDYAGRTELERIKTDFALNQVYGIEIHEILARICKINLLLHHDGHTNIEGDRSCLDTEFTKEKLKLQSDSFHAVVGNPPFGDTISQGDEDQLGKNSLDNFDIAKGRKQVPSEHIILEKSINMLKKNGVLGMILPDGLFNNQGEQSNCPQIRNYLIKHGKILAVVSLPDYAFRRSGAQNKTSILFYQKYSYAEQIAFDNVYNAEIADEKSEDEAIASALKQNSYKVFMSEAHYVGYTTTGVLSDKNDLYKGAAGGHLDLDQSGTILGEFQKFKNNTDSYTSSLPDCISVDMYDMWMSHESHRIDPKYHLFKTQENATLPTGWKRKKISELMRRREEVVKPEENPDGEVTVMTLSQTGDIRRREAGKGKNPPEWLGMYFEDSPSTWYRAHNGDVVYSSIDLWKGCISVVDDNFDGALVTKEFPIYKMLTDEIEPEFLAVLLRTRYFRKAFRAITTGHSNRRRTQTRDFEAIEVCYPPDKSEQMELIKKVMQAKRSQKDAIGVLAKAMLDFSNIIDGRGDEVDLEDTIEDENDDE